MDSKLLELLINSKGYLSGEKIAVELNVSRAAIWKRIKKLKEQGYNIESVTGKGYKLIDYKKVFNKYELDLIGKKYGLNTYLFEQIDSTNVYAKKIKDESALIVSYEQTNGRGRLGREWVSNKGQGVYFSLLLRPTLPPYIIGMITQISALALKYTIGGNSTIKWPNDIFVGDKKISGILTELITEIDLIERLIIGIGINLNSVKGFEDISTSFSEEKMIFNYFDFFDTFLYNFFELYNVFLEEKNLRFLKKEIESNSYLMNKKVTISESNQVFVFKGITDNGNAILEDTNGEIKEIFFGEISMRRGK